MSITSQFKKKHLSDMFLYMFKYTKKHQQSVTVTKRCKMYKAMKTKLRLFLRAITLIC